MNNPDCNAEPIFQPVFADQWCNLPPAIKKHYANRPYSNDVVIVEGHMHVSCARHFRLFAPFFWALGTVPPINEDNVPVTVRFESKACSKEFHLIRTFNFRNKKPYVFQSRMIQMNNNEVCEIMRFGFCWRINYFWENNKVFLQHKGYSLKILGLFVPLPITWLLGRGDAEEWAISEDKFEMCATISHPWFGKVYEYKGRFKFS